MNLNINNNFHYQSKKKKAEAKNKEQRWREWMAGLEERLRRRREEKAGLGGREGGG